MKIERIDDKTVKCFLSNEELEQYDIDYKDFVTRSEKPVRWFRRSWSRRQKRWDTNPRNLPLTCRL